MKETSYVVMGIEFLFFIVLRKFVTPGWAVQSIHNDLIPLCRDGRDRIYCEYFTEYFEKMIKGEK